MYNDNSEFVKLLLSFVFSYCRVSAHAEHNQPPVSDAGPNVTVLYPVITAQLNGSFSSDEYRIVQYNWILVR